MVVKRMSNKKVKCSVCSAEKTHIEFYKNKKNKSGLDYSCKVCRKAQASRWGNKNNSKRLAIQKNSRYKNKEKENAKARDRYYNNIEYYREKRKEYNKRYYAKNKEKEKCRKLIYRKNNVEKIRITKRKWHNKKMKTDVYYALSVRLRSRLGKAVKNGYKAGSAIDDLGCSIEFFKKYMENKFYAHAETGEMMSWNNYGKWHIDNISPLANFDLTRKEQVIIVCNYKNLQPLWAEENLRKIFPSYKNFIYVFFTFAFITYHQKLLI